MTLRNLDRYTADVGGPDTLTPREDREAGEDTETSLSLLRHATEELLKLYDRHSRCDSDVEKAVVDARYYLVCALEEMPEIAA